MRAPKADDPPEPESGFLEYPLTADDVHYMIRCTLHMKPEVWPACVVARALSHSYNHALFLSPAQFAAAGAGADGGSGVVPRKRTVHSLAVGPIEPGPPAVRFPNPSPPCGGLTFTPARAQAREVYIEGSPVVGAAAVGRVYYFGGLEVSDTHRSCHALRHCAAAPVTAGLQSLLVGEGDARGRHGRARGAGSCPVSLGPVRRCACLCGCSRTPSHTLLFPVQSARQAIPVCTSSSRATSGAC